MVTNCLAQLSAGQGSAMLATLLASLLLTSVMVTTFLASLALASNNLSRILLSVLAMLALQVVLLLQIVVQCCHYAGSLQLDIIYTNHTWLAVLLILYITFLLTLNPKYLIKKGSFVIPVHVLFLLLSCIPIVDNSVEILPSDCV